MKAIRNLQQLLYNNESNNIQAEFCVCLLAECSSINASKAERGNQVLKKS